MAGLDSMAQAFVRRGACTLPRLRIRNLDLAYPIQQGGMGVGISWEGLAGAVAREGCVGLVSAIGTGYHESANPKMRLGRPDGTDALNPPKALEWIIRAARERAEGRGAVGVNILCAIEGYEAAVRAGHASLAIFGAMHAAAETAVLENNMALAFIKLGNLPRASELVASARTKFEVLEDAQWLAHVDDTEAQIALAGSDLDLAATLAGRAIEGAELTGNKKALIAALVTHAQVRRQRGDLEGAGADFARAADLARASGSRGRIREVLGAWSEMLAESGDLRGAYDLSREALTV